MTDTKKTDDAKDDAKKEASAPRHRTEAPVAPELTEGDVRAARFDSGLTFAAGDPGAHAEWAQSPEGKEFIDGEKDRNKDAEAAAKQAADDADKQTDAQKKFAEAQDS